MNVSINRRIMSLGFECVNQNLEYRKGNEHLKKVMRYGIKRWVYLISGEPIYVFKNPLTFIRNYFNKKFMTEFAKEKAVLFYRKNQKTEKE